MECRLRIICVFSLLLFARFGKAQGFSFEEFITEKSSVRRVELAVNSWNHYLRNGIDSLLFTGNEWVKNNLNGIEKKKLIAVAERNLGSYYIRTTNVNKGIEHLNRAKDIFSNLNLKILESETENELGNAYHLVGDDKKAADHYLVSIEKGSETADQTASYNGMIGFGKVVCATGDTTNGLFFVQKYLEHALKDNKFEAASDACGFLGMIAGARGQVDLMSAYYNRGILYSSRSNSKTHNANALNNKAIDYYYREKRDSSMIYFERALKIREEIGNVKPIVESLYNLAILHIESKNFELAKLSATRAESLAGNSLLRASQIECLNLLIEIAQNTGETVDIPKLKLEVNRIQAEIDELGSIEDHVIQSALSHVDTEYEIEATSYFWELIAGVALILSALILLYRNRASSIWVGTRA